MAKWKNRTCTECGKIEHTASKSELCAACFIENKKLAKIAEEVAVLSKIGYTVVGEPIMTVTGHRRYTLIAPCCSREFSPTFGNILKQRKAGSVVPCRWCGGERRMSSAITGYIKRYGRTYDTRELQEYSTKVRRLSEATYRAYKHLLNPANHRRGRSRGSYHLDHKVPIIWCFKHGVKEESAASYVNLQLVPMEQNLSKGRKLLSDEEAHTLLNTPTVKAILQHQVPQWSGEVVPDTASVWKTDVITVREGEYLARPQAVISRLSYFTNGAFRKIGARQLEVRQVSPIEEKQFLDTWHIQGWAKSKQALGLYLAEELVAVMSFAAPRYKQAEAKHELLRFAVKGGIRVLGGAGKLLAVWLKSTGAKSVVSYSLNRWGKGEMYERLGFTKIGSNQSPTYIWPDGKIRSWRASVLMAKRKGVDLKSLVKVHDPGSTTWLLRVCI